jgi:hypothetical protein
MTIDEIFRLVNYVANKSQSGNTFTPSQFNTVAKAAQLEFISKRLGNIKNIGPNGTPPFGYKSTRKVDEDIRPLVYGPITIPIAASGLFSYPEGYMWPDAVHKTDFTTIWDVDSDQYPFIKKSTVLPPSSDYPVVVHRGIYGFIDPYSIGNFAMSYVKLPPDPIWGYTVVNDTPVYDPTTSVNFSVNPYTTAHLEIAYIMLQMVGVNLSFMELMQFSKMKEDSIS